MSSRNSTPVVTPVRRDRAGDVGAAAAHRRQGVLEVGVVRHRAEAADPLRRHGRVERLRRGQVHDVLEVQVARRLARRRRSARSASSRARRRRAARRPASRRGRGAPCRPTGTSTSRTLRVVNSKAAERVPERVVDSTPSRVDCTHDGRDLVERVGARRLVLRLHAEQPQHAVGDAVQRPDDGLEHASPRRRAAARAAARRGRAPRTRGSWGSSRRRPRAGRSRAPARRRRRRRRWPRPSAASRPSGISSRWWIAGSDTLRMTSEQTVMPSWLVASISVACSIAQSVVFAALLPASARGSICERRAEMTANSAPTKKPLTISSTTSQMMPGRYSVHGSNRPSARSRRGRARRGRRAGRLRRRGGVARGARGGRRRRGPPRRGRPPRRAARTAARSRRVPTTRSTRSAPPAISTSSPTSGRRSRRSATKPADGLVVAVVGHRGSPRVPAARRDGATASKTTVPPERTMPARARSCSSSSSPTSSSTRSSRVTRPAVPPNSSVTTAIWKPLATQQAEQRVGAHRLGHEARVR